MHVLAPSPLFDTAAAGDVVVGINGVSCKGMTAQQVMSWRLCSLLSQQQPWVVDLSLITIDVNITPLNATTTTTTTTMIHVRHHSHACRIDVVAR